MITICRFLYSTIKIIRGIYFALQFWMLVIKSVINYRYLYGWVSLCDVPCVSGLNFY